jgi:PAP2 superfamily
MCHREPADSMINVTTSAATEPAPAVHNLVRPVRPRAVRELALLAVLYVGYSAARLLADGDPSRAITNARRLLDLEAGLHVDVESWANHLLTGVPGLALAGSYWYSALHYLVTPTVLIWVYRRHPLGYRRVRNALVIATATGLAGFVLLPMAPPRMLPGYVDTLATTAAHGWWGSDASAPKGLGGLTNELAAMPSLHVGWALWVAWVVVLCSRSGWLRALAATYALGTVLVVVGTANHYVLDAVAGAAVVGLGIALTRPHRVVPGVRDAGSGPDVPVWEVTSGPQKRSRGHRAVAVDRRTRLRQGHPGDPARGAVRHHPHLQR